MESLKPQKLLLEYLNATPKETFKRKMELEYPELAIEQIDKIAEHLKEFCSYSKGGEVLLLFPYILNNIRFVNPQISAKTAVKELWKRGFADQAGSEERLRKMYSSWVSLEKELEEPELRKQHTPIEIER